jgi:hypothetical protein
MMSYPKAFVKVLVGNTLLLLPCDRVVLLLAIGYLFLFVSIVN